MSIPTAPWLCFVKPAGSQVQTAGGHVPIKKRQQVDVFSWSGRQDLNLCLETPNMLNESNLNFQASPMDTHKDTKF